MDVLKRADGSEIHSDVMWAFNTANRKDETKIERIDLYRADALLQEMVEENDKLLNIFRRGFLSGNPREIDAISLGRSKTKFVNQVNNLLKNITFDMDTMVIISVLNTLKEALGDRKDKSFQFAKQLKTLLETWAKYGNNAKAKNLIDDMRENLASSAKVVQRYLLEGKGNLKSDVSKLFLSPSATFEDGKWSEVREYNGKSSIDIIQEIYQFARIKIRTVGELEAGMKGVEQYYSLDIDKFVDEITELIQTKNADPAKHYRLFFNADNILRMIYRLIPDIIYTTNEDMSENEMKAELEKQFDALEYLIRINTLTGDFSRLKESRLKRVRRISTKFRGSTLKMNREFPNLETAWELYEEDPEKYAPEATKRRQKAPKEVKPQSIGVRVPKDKKTGLPRYELTYPPNKERGEKIESLEDKINAYSRKIEEVKPALTSGQLEEKQRLTMERTMNTFKESLSKIESKYGDIDKDIKTFEELLENLDVGETFDLSGEEVSGEEVKEIYVEHIRDLKENKKTTERLEKQIEILERVLSNMPKQKQSLDEPSSDEATGESE